MFMIERSPNIAPVERVSRIKYFSSRQISTFPSAIEVSLAPVFLDNDAPGGVVFDGGRRCHGAKLFRGNTGKER